MTPTTPGFVATVKSLPRPFWIANTMEIFERMAWYGFFAVSSLYITGPVETGGLGFTSEERGQLQAIVPFFLYLFPVITGALADRYGYKKMFIIAYVCMILSYYGLGQFKTFPTFLMAFMFVAVAAAIFKPVVVGTVARVTNDGNSSLGFGIFYMMVNIGGFLGPLVAGAVRGVSWKYVFIACAGWAAVNLVIVLIFYREPTSSSDGGKKRSLAQVGYDMVEVLGNVRFGVTVLVALVALMIANQEWDFFLFWPHCTIFVSAWLLLNAVWDLLMPKGSGNPRNPASHGRPFFLKRMHCSNWRFALFLLIMSGFWTSFQQIFITMPEFVRDYVDTKPMVNAGRKMFGAINRPKWIDGLAAIEETEVMSKFDSLVRRARGIPSMVPSNPTPTEIKQERIDTLELLKQLKKKSAELDSEDQAAITKAIASLKEAESLPPNEMTATTDQAGRLAARLDRELTIKHLPDDRAMTPEKLDELRQMADRLTVPPSTNPLQAVDLVKGARTMLAYKVRIEPLELGELMARVPDRPETIEEKELTVAVETINKRLDLRQEPEYKGDQEQQLRTALTELMTEHGTFVPMDALVRTSEALTSGELTMKPKVLALGIRDLAYRPTIWNRMDAGRQVNPEHIINFDALSIILLQVIISFFMARFHQFTTMIVGMVVAAVGIGLSAIAGGTMIGPVGGLLLVVIVGIVTFAIGEMMASPTSQEYVGRIAPADKKALYMGYYFVAIALGNLFGGILSGQLYGKLTRDMQRPDLMWLAFGGIMLGTAIIFLLYNMFALPKHASGSLTNNKAA